MSAKPTVYLLCGFIGAGKTTFAQQLELRTGAVRITKDACLIRLIGHDATIPGYAESDRKIIELSREVAFQFVAQGIDVILDEGFWDKEERATMRRRIEGMGAEAVPYYLDAPIAVIRARVARRSADPPPDSFRISDELLDVYLAKWEPPGDDEDYVLAREIS